MKKKIIKTEMKVKDNLVGVMRVGDVDYISLTDLAKFKNDKNPSNVIIHWLSNKDTAFYVGLWEELNNENFNFTEYSEIKINEIGTSSYTMSPKQWIQRTNAIVSSKIELSKNSFKAILNSSHICNSEFNKFTLFHLFHYFFVFLLIFQVVILNHLYVSLFDYNINFSSIIVVLPCLIFFSFLSIMINQYILEVYIFVLEYIHDINLNQYSFFLICA